MEKSSNKRKKKKKRGKEKREERTRRQLPKKRVLLETVDMAQRHQSETSAMEGENEVESDGEST